MSVNKRTPLPTWVYEALRALPSRELEELAAKTGVSARQLWRIRSGRTQFVRGRTLEQLQRHLNPSYALSVREIVQQIYTDKDLDRLFDLLMDTPRISLKIHGILVERGWGVIKFKTRLCELAAAQQGKQYRFQVERDPSALQRFLEIFDRVKGHKIREELRQTSSLILQRLGKLATTEGVQEILLGEGRLTLETLCFIADALGVDPSEIFVSTPKGKKVFQEVLIRSSRSRKPEDQQVNRLLNRVRSLLGIEF